MNDIDALFDTNIVIYIVNGKEKYVSASQQLGKIGVSVVSYMEVLIGAKNVDEEQKVVSLLFDIEIVPLDAIIAFDVTQSLLERAQKNLRSPFFPDTTIAHTALSLGVPLVTNNPKDFSVFKELELIVP